MNERDPQAELVRLLPSRKGHFRLESGHHGDLWLDLELLCLRPEPVQRTAAHLAARLAAHQVEVVCGPLIEGVLSAAAFALPTFNAATPNAAEIRIDDRISVSPLSAPRPPVRDYA